MKLEAPLASVSAEVEVCNTDAVAMLIYDSCQWELSIGPVTPLIVADGTAERDRSWEVGQLQDARARGRGLDDPFRRRPLDLRSALVGRVRLARRIVRDRQHELAIG